MKTTLLIFLILASLNAVASEVPYECTGKSHFGLRSYSVEFDYLKVGSTVNLKILSKSGELLIDESVKLKADYMERELINLQGLGLREIDLTGYINIAQDDGYIFFDDREIDLKNCSHL